MCLPEEREREEGEVGKGGREYSSVRKYKPYKVCGANVKRGERAGLQ